MYQDMTDRQMLEKIASQNDVMISQQEKVIEIANAIRAEVGPLVERLQSHPMARMILGGK